MNTHAFPEIPGAAKLDLVLPQMCSNCGSPNWMLLREVPLNLSRFGLGLVRAADLAMDLPFCERCERDKATAPVTVNAVNMSFIGKVTRIFLHCRNHDFAEAFKSLNHGLVSSGWLQVVDGDLSEPRG